MSWIGKIGLAVIGATCLFSCDLIHDDDMKCQHYTADGVPFAYVGLNISAGNANQVTKANPTGGEEGDGREEGVRDENVVSTITAFFFESDKGINSDASTPIVARRSWPSTAFTYKGNTRQIRLKWSTCRWDTPTMCWSLPMSILFSVWM